jgi:hypothetical protein
MVVKLKVVMGIVLLLFVSFVGGVFAQVCCTGNTNCIQCHVSAAAPKASWYGTCGPTGCDGYFYDPKVGDSAYVGIYYGTICYVPNYSAQKSVQGTKWAVSSNQTTCNASGGPPLPCTGAYTMKAAEGTTTFWNSQCVKNGSGSGQ